MMPLSMKRNGMDDAEDLSRRIVSKADENQINPVGSDANAPRQVFQ